MKTCILEKERKKKCCLLSPIALTERLDHP